jgi:hypothetical protein
MVQHSWIIFYFQTCQKHSFCKGLQIKNEIAASGHFPFAMRVYWDYLNPVSNETAFSFSDYGVEKQNRRRSGFCFFVPRLKVDSDPVITPFIKT